MTRGTPTTVDQVPSAKIGAPARPKARTTPAAKRPAVKPRPATRRPAALRTTLQVAQSQVGGPQTRYTTESARAVRRRAEILGFGRPPAPTSTTVIPAPPPVACEWREMGKPFLCDWS